MVERVACWPHAPPYKKTMSSACGAASHGNSVTIPNEQNSILGTGSNIHITVVDIHTRRNQYAMSNM